MKRRSFLSLLGLAPAAPAMAALAKHLPEVEGKPVPIPDEPVEAYIAQDGGTIECWSCIPPDELPDRLIGTYKR